MRLLSTLETSKHCHARRQLCSWPCPSPNTHTHTHARRPNAQAAYKDADHVRICRSYHRFFHCIYLFRPCKEFLKNRFTNPRELDILKSKTNAAHERTMP